MTQRRLSLHSAGNLGGFQIAVRPGEETARGVVANGVDLREFGVDHRPAKTNSSVA
jgi:hypothetical protein